MTAEASQTPAIRTVVGTGEAGYSGDGGLGMGISACAALKGERYNAQRK